MFDRIFSRSVKPPEPRMKKKIEAQKIIEFIDKLQNKTAEFKKTSDSLGPASLDYAKHAILASLNQSIDTCVKSFNEKSMPSDEIKEIQEFVDLLREINAHLAFIFLNHFQTLNIHRQDHTFSRSVYALGRWGSVGAAFMCTGVMLGVGAFMVSASISAFLEKNTNLFNNNLTATCELLKQFSELLTATIKNLMLVLNLKQLQGDPLMISNEDNMMCPITQDLMEDPYLCKLDGYSYEKTAIVQCLTESRKSPMTRRLMAVEEKVEDVIIPNRALKNIIENYKLYRSKKIEMKEVEGKAVIHSHA